MVPVKDTISRDSVIKDSIFRAEIAGFYKRLDTAIYNNNPFYQFKNPLRRITSERVWKGKEGFFLLHYCFAALFCTC
jgi:hypothetical protein